MISISSLHFWIFVTTFHLFGSGISFCCFSSAKSSIWASTCILRRSLAWRSSLVILSRILSLSCDILDNFCRINNFKLLSDFLPFTSDCRRCVLVNFFLKLSSSLFFQLSLCQNCLLLFYTSNCYPASIIILFEKTLVVENMSLI